MFIMKYLWVQIDWKSVVVLLLIDRMHLLGVAQ